MKISSKGITAVKLFLDLGEHYEEGFVSLIDVSKRKDISKKFLEQIVPIFKNNGLLQVKGGNQGGYRLAKEPKYISLWDILYLTESVFVAVSSGCSPLDEAFSSVDRELENYLSSITLESLVEKQIESYANMWSI